MTGFSADEARAGHALVRREVEAAEWAVARARSRRERREAESALAEARAKERMSEAAARGLAAQLGIDPAELLPPEDQESNEEAHMDSMSKQDVLRTVRHFGDRRSSGGDLLFEDPDVQGSFFYESGPRRTGVCMWGGETSWVLSIFAAARVRIRPSLALHQYVSRRRSSDPAGAPYVVESHGEAAILCERLFQSSQFVDDATANLMICSTIDLIGEAADEISRALVDSNDGGMPFTATGLGGLATLKSWWGAQN